MKWFLSVFLFTSLAVQADVSPEHVESMLQQMVRENVISPEEAEKAKIRMKAKLERNETKKLLSFESSFFV